MEYRKVYFRIRSRYQFDSGWPAETDAAKFHEESRSLFQSAGWDLQPGGDSTSDTVTKGWQELYLHPMNFSGIIEMDEIPAIQELLKDAKSFCCYGFDCYERYWDITDEEYLAQLETKREEITHEILERCRTKRKNLYITGPVALNVAQKFSVHRLCDKEGKHNLANRFVGELMEQLVQDGLLVTRKTRNGPGVRTATDAEISSPTARAAANDPVNRGAMEWQFILRVILTATSNALGANTSTAEGDEPGDYVVIAGDFGGLWDGSQKDQYWLDWLNKKPFTTLFVDGNHENFDLLNTLPEKRMEWRTGPCCAGACPAPYAGTGLRLRRPHLVHNGRCGLP